MLVKKFNVVFLVLILISLSSCASPYIGRTVKMNHPTVCKFKSFPKTCVSSDGNFEIIYKIEKLNEENNYYVEGSAKYLGSATWESFSKAYFTLLLAKDAVIVETVQMASGQGSLGRTLVFSRKFTTKGKFEAVLISYNMDVQG